MSHGGFDAWFAHTLRKNAAERWLSAGEAAAAFAALVAKPVGSSATPATEPFVGPPLISSAAAGVVEPAPSVTEVATEEKAVDLYQRACDGGDMRGCSYLGLAFEYGKGDLIKNEKKAVELYRRACDGGDCSAGSMR